ncbi:hypothetical protein QJS10_CPB21g00475 [Acorus calamus]|uniref:Uncharacterized protein n=1 Tax=Acorus calamus TaxID=4465 RepID=A0AAV9C5W8_ACOCL|nr:hypothetical protein QJS10_CPB21g00475 [Acorus calamus]
MPIAAGTPGGGPPPPPPGGTGLSAQAISSSVGGEVGSLSLGRLGEVDPAPIHVRLDPRQPRCRDVSAGTSSLTVATFRGAKSETKEVATIRDSKYNPRADFFPSEFK